MANICGFDLELRCENRDNLQTMCNYLMAGYDYSNKKCPVQDSEGNPVDHHIGSRMECFSANIMDKKEDGKYVAYASGTCAWSGESLLTSEAPQLKYSLGLAEACKMLGVWCMMDTEETDIGFREHYIFDENGDMIEEDYEELYAEGKTCLIENEDGEQGLIYLLYEDWCYNESIEDAVQEYLPESKFIKEIEEDEIEEYEEKYEYF